MMDAAHLEAWRSGDRQSGAVLFERYYDLVDRFFRNKAGDASSDLVQETFLRMVRTRARIREDTTFRCYLFGVARLVLFEHYRSLKRARERIDFAKTTLADLGPTPTTVIAQAREERVLLQALRSIPIELQVLLELYYWENLNGRELAAATGVPEGTVRTRLRRARKLLEQQIEVLSASAVDFKSTMTHLDRWASELRKRMGEQASS